MLACGACAALLSAAACVAPNALKAPTVTPPRGLAEDYAGGVKVKRVAIVGPAASADKDAKALRSALVAQLEASFPQRDPKLPPVEVDLVYHAHHTIYRALILDLIAAETAGLFPFTPQWGRARAELRLDVTTPSQLGLTRRRFSLSHDASYRYLNVLYSWFRKASVEAAYDKAHLEAFEGGVGRLGMALADQPVGKRELVGFEQTYPRRGMRFDFDEKGELVKRQLLDPWRWRVIYDASIYDHGTTKRAPGFWHTYFSALSGVEGGYFRGLAWVSSDARNERTGERFTIASGKATSEGYKFSLFTPPTESRFFVYPTFGFFSLNIDIEDMAGDIPLVQVAGAKDVPAIGRDPVSGEVIDLGAPNVYNLRLRSLYLGQRVGGTMVFGTPNAQLFFSAEGGLNLVEGRYTAATLGGYSDSKVHAAAFGSFAGRLLVGFAYRPLHVAARCELNFEYYRSFDFPQPLPFEAPPSYNALKQTYERVPIKVDAAGAGTLNGYCGVSFAY